MKTLVIDETKAKGLYKTASSELKAVLEDTFSKSFFSEKITDRIRDYGDILDIADTAERFFICSNDTVDEIAYKRAKLIAKVLNEGTVLDWSDGNQAKYFPWFTYKKGSGLVFGDVDDFYSTTYVGSRLCFKSRELAEFAAAKFPQIYIDLLN